MMIYKIHKHGDYQTQNYHVGFENVISIERFSIPGLYAEYPRIRVTLDDGDTIEMDEQKMCVYERKCKQ